MSSMQGMDRQRGILCCSTIRPLTLLFVYSTILAAKGHADTSMSKEVEIINNDHGGNPAGRQFETQASGHVKRIPVSKKVEEVCSDHRDGNSSGHHLKNRQQFMQKVLSRAQLRKRRRR